MLINRTFLCSAGGQNAARLMINGQDLPSELEEHREAAEYIRTAVDAGWFMLPYWRESGSYSREQFGDIHHHLQAHPDIPEAERAAQEALSHATATFKRPLFELFGSSRNNRLPSPTVMAKNAHLHCPRKPLEFVAWQFTAEDYCDLVEDVSANCRHVHQLAAALTWPGMLDASACLATKIDHLQTVGRADWITAIVKSVHHSYLSLESMAELKKAAYGRISGRAFTEFVAKDLRASESASQATWRATKAMIRNIAAVLGDTKSYHQATLTKLLRSELGREFGIRTIDGLQGKRLVVSTSTHHELGSNSKLITPFELVNWLLALDTAITKCTNDVHGFWEACTQADAVIDRMRKEAA